MFEKYLKEALKAQIEKEYTQKQCPWTSHEVETEIDNRMQEFATWVATFLSSCQDIEKLLDKV